MGLTVFDGWPKPRSVAARTHSGLSVASAADKLPNLINRRRVILTGLFLAFSFTGEFLMPVLSQQNITLVTQPLSSSLEIIRSLLQTRFQEFPEAAHSCLPLECNPRIPKRLEDSRIGFVPAQAQSRGDVQRHLVAAMGDAALGRPSVLAQHFQYAQILHEPVAERAVELQNIPIRPQSAIADQIARVLHRKEVFAGRQWSVI